jgi:hypothetical protein
VNPTPTSKQRQSRRDTGKDILPVIEIESYRKSDTIEPASTSAFETPKKKHPYYDYGKLLSYNAVYNYLVGGRGLGKTFGAKKRALRRFLSHGEQFIYLRRYKEELVTVRETFFADVAHEFPDWDFRTNGNVFEVSPASQRDNKRRDWETIGYLMALSVAQKQKSVSFHRVKTIIFDEFIIEKGVVHYLPDEANVFNNFYSTVDRYQDKTTVFFLANAVSITNPYFLEYNIMPVEGDEWIRLHNGFMVIHLPKAEEFAASVLQTRFGQFIAGTDYAKYAVGNEFVDNNLDLVAAKDPNAKYKYTLETAQGTFSLWQNLGESLYYAVQKRPGNELMFTLLPERMSENKTLLMPNDMALQMLRSAYRHGRIWFDTPKTRNAFVDVFKRR